MITPVLRSKSITAKVTEEEYARLQELVLAQGQNLGELARLALLEKLNPVSPAQEILLAEVLALRTILLNVLFGMANGEKLTAEEMQKLIEKAEASKGQKAMEKLTGKASGSRNGGGR